MPACKFVLLFIEKIHITWWFYAPVPSFDFAPDGKTGVDYGLFILEQALEQLFSIVVSLTCTIYLSAAFFKLHLVPQIYDNATRFNANKFATFALWKFRGNKQQNTCTNGRGSVT